MFCPVSMCDCHIFTTFDCMHVSVVKKFFMKVFCQVSYNVLGQCSYSVFCPVLVVIWVDEVKVNIRVTTFRHHVGPYHVFLKEKKISSKHQNKDKKEKEEGGQDLRLAKETQPSSD